MTLDSDHYFDVFVITHLRHPFGKSICFSFLQYNVVPETRLIYYLSQLNMQIDWKTFCIQTSVQY